MEHEVRPAIAIVVLTWNGRADTLRCLESLDAGDRAVHVVVVDNGSDDGTAAAVRDRHAAVTLLHNPSNLGFSAGNNLGIQWALAEGFDVIGVLNNDTVARKDFLGPLVREIEQCPNGLLVSPLIVYADSPQNVWFGNAARHARTDIFVHEPVERDITAGTTQTPMLTGCAMFAHRSVWQRLRGFDERYFLIFEDADLSARAAALDIRMVVVNDSVIEHAVSSTIRRRAVGASSYYYMRNSLLFVRQHSRRPCRSACALIAERGRETARSIRTNGFRSNAPICVLYGRGVFDAARHRYGRLRPGPVVRWALGVSPSQNEAA